MGAGWRTASILLLVKFARYERFACNRLDTLRRFVSTMAPRLGATYVHLLGKVLVEGCLFLLLFLLLLR